MIAAGLALFAAAAAAGARYELGYEPVAERMRVRLCIDAAAAVREFRLQRGGADYVEDLRRERGELRPSGEARWRAADWRAGECLTYVAKLGAVVQGRDREVGSRVGEVLLVAPQAWLLQDATTAGGEAVVTMPPDQAFAPPWQELARDGAATRYTIPATPFGWSAMIAVGRFEETRLRVGDSLARLTILGTTTAGQRATLRGWVERALAAAATGYGDLPLPQVQVVLFAGGRRGPAVGFGQSLRGQGNAVHIQVDANASAAALDADWTAVHEFSHWAHPYLGDDGAWLAEGLASYWQYVLRARSGALTPQQAWSELDAGFGRGLRTADDSRSLAELSQAMHARRAYYAVYWSGAAFWLTADVELRKRSGGRIGIDTALQRFHACCLERKREWGAEEFVAKLDALVGSDVLRREYRAFAARRGFPPLDALYARLGLQRDGDALQLADDAPDAAIRDAIVRRRAPPPTERASSQ